MNTFQFNYRPRAWLTAFALSAFVVGCGSGSDDPAAAPVAPVAPVADPVGAACTGGEACVPLASAGNYTILTQNGVTTTGATAITGHVGSTAAASSTTGFSETLSADGTFATSAQVIGGGRMYAIDYQPPTPAEMTQAITDAGAAFNDADNVKQVGVGNLDRGTAGNITGEEFAPGVYEWSAGGITVDAAGVITLTGTATDVWVFKIPGGITMGSGSTVTLANGALPQNVFWRTGDVVALEPTANLKGIVLAGSSVTLGDGASVDGRLIATTNVTLIANAVTRPAP
ncbi:MAG TPA: ice-binding family protein [Gammaproteobacteria bacterium]|nr:ice-binding family protein [Gammaproteobacteria bacterium]